MYPEDVSKHNSKHGKQVILLMIRNREGLYYLALNKISALLKAIRQKMMVIFFV